MYGLTVLNVYKQKSPREEAIWARGVSLQSIFLIPIDTYVDIKRPVPFISDDIFGRPL